MATEEDKKREVASRFAMLGLNPDHYETADQMLEDANGRLNNLTKNQAPGRMAMWKNGEGAMPENAPQAPQRSIRRPFNMQAYSGANPVQQGFIDQFGPAAQARSLGGMISNVQNTIQDENDSRVAQMREQRRMNQEMAIESMRQEALLQRLAMEQKEREKDRILQRQLQTGVTRKRLVNGRWEYI
jgi:hypothetical protein